MRILHIDIETAPVRAAVWGLWQQNVGLNQIEKDWYILSFAAKWHGKRGVIYMDKSDSWDTEDDYSLLEKLHELLNEADVIVAQNGVRFDRKKINARFIMNGFKPPSPYKVIDTLLVAKREFGFTSNKLEYMTDNLCTHIKKRKHQKFPGYSLWAECLKGNEAAWKEMRLYNIDDVRSMEELYGVLLPWITAHPNHGLYVDSASIVCDKCGSSHVTKNGKYKTQVGIYQQYICNDCGGWSRGRTLLNSAEERKRLIVGVI